MLEAVVHYHGEGQPHGRTSLESDKVPRQARAVVFGEGLEKGVDMSTAKVYVPYQFYA